MSRINHSQFFKIISIVLVTTFISLDISWAYPPEHNTNNFTLATPSLLQQTPINERAARFQQSLFSQGELLGSVCSIGKYLLEDKLPIKHLEQVISAELGRAVEGIDLSRVTVKDSVVLIPCVIKGKKQIIQIALKGSVADKDSDVRSRAAETSGKISSVMPKPVLQQAPKQDIYAEIIQEPQLKKELILKGLFPLVQSKVPASMESLTNALKELEPLSEQVNLSKDAISQAIAQAKGKYKLSEKETKILWLALTGPGQGVGAGQIVTELQAKWTEKMRNAEESGIKVNVSQLDEIASTKKAANGIEYFESKIHGMGISGDNQWHKEGAIACPFDATKFNFTKLYRDIRPQHVLYEASLENDNWYIGMNDMPILRYHMIVAPREARQQLATRKDLIDMQELLAQIGDEKAALLHNSLLSGAGINSLHYHLHFYDSPIFKEGFPIYSGTGKFVTKSFTGKNCAQEAGAYLEELQEANQPYNLVMKYGKIIIIPRPQDLEFRYGADALAGVVLYGNDRTLEEATWHMPEASKQENIKPEPEATAKVNNLFEIVESSVNNHRAEFIEVGNKLINSIPTKPDSQEVSLDIGNLDKKMPTAEIKQRVERALAAMESLNTEGVTPEAKVAIELLKKSLNQFEVDGAVGSLIVLARKAKRENQKLIIGLETDWIPGINVQNSLQRQAITALMKEIDDIAEALQSMGLDSVEVIRGSGSQLADTILNEAEKTRTKMHNIVVMASVNTINSDSFAALRNADESDRPFLTGIDPTELIKLYTEFGETVSKQLYIRLASLLYMTLELAAGKEPPQSPIIVSYDKKMRILILLPKADPMDYELLKNNYVAEKLALQAA